MSRRTASGLIGACLWALLAACAPAEEPGTGAGTVDRLLADLVAADNAGDLDAVLACYDRDAVLLPPHGEPVEGIGRIREHYRDLFATTALEIRLEPGPLRQEGDQAVSMGYTVGRVTPKGGGPPAEVHDRYVMYLRRGPDGAWRITRLLWDPVADRDAPAS